MDPVTPLYVSIAASVASILLILVVFELIRSRRLRERYALLWLATGVVLLVLSAWRGGLNTIAGWVGVTGYPPAVLFAVATLFILAVLLHYSTVISKLADQNVILAQRLALLEQRVGPEREPSLGVALDRLADRGHVAGGGVVARVGGDADPIARAGWRGAVAPAGLARGPEQHHPQVALLGAAVLGALKVGSCEVSAVHAVEDIGATGRGMRPGEGARFAFGVDVDVDLTVDRGEDIVDDDRRGRQADRADERNDDERNEREADGEADHEPAVERAVQAPAARCAGGTRRASARAARIETASRK